MILVDKALAQRESEGRPIRVGLIGSGYMGRGVAYQIARYTSGMRLSGIANRSFSGAVAAYELAGLPFIHANAAADADAALRQDIGFVTDSIELLCNRPDIDVVFEVTGDVEYGARAAMTAISARKHFLHMNAELDATIGPYLKGLADQAGVIYSNSDGDQPGVIMNLLRWVRQIGCRPVLAGNMKGLQDPYRTPETQKGFAERYGQKPQMVTSFADGTKISMEMAVVANATGMIVGKRGMFGPTCAHVKESPELFPSEQMLQHGIVDYVLGAEPAGGIFVIGHLDDPVQQQYLDYYKMGSGPFYVFYTPYHLCHMEAPMTIARAVLFSDAAVEPIGSPVAEVLCFAKRDLSGGEVLDGMGGFMTYGVLDNSGPARNENLLPMGLSPGCTIRRAVAEDEPLSLDDVDPPQGSLSWELWTKQFVWAGEITRKKDEPAAPAPSRTIT